MKNNKHSLYLLVLLLCTSITSVMAQVTIATPYSMAVNALAADPTRGDATTGAYTVGAGTNRLLVAFVMGEDGGDTNIAPTDVSYGTMPMTKVAESAFYQPGFDTYTSMWILKEADIATALGDAFVVNWNTVPGSGGQIDAIVFANVNQTTPTGATSINNAASLIDIEGLTLLKPNTGDMIIANVATSNFSSTTHTWENGFTDAVTGTRPTGGFGMSLGGYKVGAGVDELVKCTGSATQARRVILGAIIKKAGSLSVGDNHLAANAVNVYPNPASDVLNIDSVVSSEKVINVINSLGQVVSTTKSSGNAQVNLKSLNVSGFVIVQVIADGKVSNHKVIVK